MEETENLFFTTRARTFNEVAFAGQKLLTQLRKRLNTKGAICKNRFRNKLTEFPKVS